MRAELRSEPGWLGVFTRQQAEGALANGSRIEKVEAEVGDGRPVGSLGTVLGSVPNPGVRGPLPNGRRAEDVRFAYFVEWDAAPRVAVGVVDWKIAEHVGAVSEEAVNVPMPHCWCGAALTTVEQLQITQADLDELVSAGVDAGTAEAALGTGPWRQLACSADRAHCPPTFVRDGGVAG